MATRCSFNDSSDDIEALRAKFDGEFESDEDDSPRSDYMPETWAYCVP